MQRVCCDHGSGWACNELGINRAANLGEIAGARGEFERGCALDFRPSCENVLRLASGTSDLAEAPPPIEDFPTVIRGSKGPVLERDPAALYALACDRGWPDTCEGPPAGME